MKTRKLTMNWRRMAVAAVVIGVVASVPSPAWAVERPTITVIDGQTQPVYSYQDAIREHVRVQSSVDSDGDGKRDLIRADIVRPREANGRLRVPVIMHASPYFDVGVGYERETKAYDQNGNATKIPLWYDNYFVPRGYAVVSVDMTGTGKSDGCPTAGGVADVLGVKAVVDWLNGRVPAYDDSGNPVTASWTTGRTGMIGHSYDGLLAAAVAGTGVQGLATIVPLSLATNLYEMLRANGTLSWFRDALAQITAFIDKDPPQKCAAVRQLITDGSDDATGNYNAFWNERNYRTGPVAEVSRMQASVFAVMGLNDMNVKSSQLSLWWDELAKRGVTRKLWLAQYGHVDPFDFRREAWVRSLHRWFDHELWGIPNGILRQPRVDVQLGPNHWITQADWPAPAARDLKLWPSDDGSLGIQPSSGTGTYTDSMLHEADLIANPETANPSRLVYRTPALEQDLRLSGTPKVSIELRSDKPAANLSVLLVDYGTGTQINPTYGIKPASDEDCVGASTPQDDACYGRFVDDTVTADAYVVGRGTMDTQNRQSLSFSVPLTPGASYRITWSLLPTDYLLRTGHRLGLVLAGTNAELAAAETPTGATVTVDLSHTEVSVPVVTVAGDAAPTAP